MVTVMVMVAYYVAHSNNYVMYYIDFQTVL